MRVRPPLLMFPLTSTHLPVRGSFPPPPEGVCTHEQGQGRGTPGPAHRPPGTPPSPRAAPQSAWTEGWVRGARLFVCVCVCVIRAFSGPPQPDLPIPSPGREGCVENVESGAERRRPSMCGHGGRLDGRHHERKGAGLVFGAILHTPGHARPRHSRPGRPGRPPGRPLADHLHGRLIATSYHHR